MMTLIDRKWPLQLGEQLVQIAKFYGYKARLLLIAYCVCQCVLTVGVYARAQIEHCGTLDAFYSTKANSNQCR